MAEANLADHLVTLEDALADGRVADFLPGCEGDFAAVVAELKEARAALSRITDALGRDENWHSPSSTLEYIGDLVDSERYPVWEQTKS